MTTEIVKFDEVIKQSGLAIQEGEEIKQSYLPFAIQLAGIQDQAGKINFEKPTPTDEIIARDLRLRTVKIRTGASDLKDSRKKIHLLKGNLEQAAYNLIAASCKLSEEAFTTVEKARENAEAKRIREENDRLQKQLETERKAAEEKARLEREESEAKLKAEREARVKAEAEIKAKADQERKAAEEKARIESARLLAEKKAKSAPDKQKLESLGLLLRTFPLPEMKTIEGMTILDNVKELLKKTSEFITKKVGEI